MKMRDLLKKIHEINNLQQRIEDQGDYFKRDMYEDKTIKEMKIELESLLDEEII